MNATSSECNEIAVLVSADKGGLLAKMSMKRLSSMSSVVVHSM